MMTNFWIFSFAAVGLFGGGWLADYAAGKIGIPDYGSNIPFHWGWTPVYFVACLASGAGLLISIFGVLTWL